jgi:plasmid stabilization system protein ParE
MKKPVEFVQEAEAEYLAALVWYWERSPSAATRFEAEVENAINRIQEAPESWATFMGARRFLLHHFPFAIVYQDSAAAIRILAVAHCRRKPGYWKTRR